MRARKVKNNMKIISVNTWGGRAMDEFKDFLLRHSDTDVFCLQEVYHEAHGKDTLWDDGSNFNFLNDIKGVFTNYDYYYRPHLSDWWGLAMLVKKGPVVLEEGEWYVHKHNGHNPPLEIQGYTAKNIQFLTIEHHGKPFSILNFHGLWNGKGKGDTEDRLSQSQKIIECIRTLQTEYVLLGDFNLNPDTGSLRLLEQELGCRNLIAEYGITSTRTHLYPKENKFADYAFISKGVVLKKFEVLPDVVSDHAPLLVEVE